jgi:hypothetical protein
MMLFLVYFAIGIFLVLLSPLYNKSIRNTLEDDLKISIENNEESFIMLILSLCLIVCSLMWPIFILIVMIYELSENLSHASKLIITKYYNFILNSPKIVIIKNNKKDEE